jgi:hypothetical protein
MNTPSPKLAPEGYVAGVDPTTASETSRADLLARMTRRQVAGS